MSIKDLYANENHKQQLSHFASIVKIAIADQNVTEGEKNLLIKTAKRLGLTTDEFNRITKNPDAFPIHTPVSYDDRIEHLYRLTKMIFADNEVELREVKLMRKIAIGLHFSVENVEKVCDEAIHLILNDNDLEDFTLAIKKVDSI